jgi:hypothetical protein
MQEWERTEREREAILHSLGLPEINGSRKTFMLKRALKQPSAHVPEKYAAKIRQEVIDSLDILLAERNRELKALSRCRLPAQL